MKKNIVCLFVCLFVCVSVCLFVCVSVCLFVSGSNVKSQRSLYKIFNRENMSFGNNHS
jgi:hypothetical protein